VVFKFVEFDSYGFSRFGFALPFAVYTFAFTALVVIVEVSVITDKFAVASFRGDTH